MMFEIVKPQTREQATELVDACVRKDVVGDVRIQIAYYSNDMGVMHEDYGGYRRTSWIVDALMRHVEGELTNLTVSYAHSPYPRVGVWFNKRTKGEIE